MEYHHVEATQSLQSFAQQSSRLSNLFKMHAKSVLAALALPALISGAAIPQDPAIPDWDENTADIVGGVAAAQGDFPFIVSVQLSGSHLCGGTLVNANTVISAAHCYYGRTSSSFRIRAGSLVSILRPPRSGCRY